MSQLRLCIEEMLKEVMLSSKLVSPECVRLFLVLPAYILQPPLDSPLFATFAASLTALSADWRALIGEPLPITE